jgi:hypothetical protein
MAALSPKAEVPSRSRYVADVPDSDIGWIIRSPRRYAYEQIRCLNRADFDRSRFRPNRSFGLSDFGGGGPKVRALAYNPHRRFYMRVV